MSQNDEISTYSDEHGRVIPHLLTTNPSYWPPKLIDALKRELKLTPQECIKLSIGSEQRFEFDQLVRRWHTFGGKEEADTFISCHSGIISAMCGD
ncbi:hypothetical protein KW782_04145 [Candidatus Parcubacteria bacterium]|nr:hypothetical protein [Candidatus Parcubacteria bacterium]